MLIDANGREINLGDKVIRHRIEENEYTTFLHEKNEYGKNFLFQLDKDGNIVNNKFAHSPADNSVKLVNSKDIKWYKKEYTGSNPITQETTDNLCNDI